MCPNEVKLTRVGEGSYEIPFDYGQMKDIHIENWWEVDFSNTKLLAAAVLNCITSSFEYELDVLKKGARYDTLDSKIHWRYSKDESGRRVIDSIVINVNLDVPDARALTGKRWSETPILGVLGKQRLKNEIPSNI